jgi:transcriptional regulator with PAS, ATPase and Fis domain
MVAEGKMRSDFYYRINVIPIQLIPLRQRKVDIPLLVQDFLHRHSVATSKNIGSVSKQVMRQLVEYPWPGNIRELQNVLERAMVLTTGRAIEAVDLPGSSAEHTQDRKSTSTDSSLSDWLKEQEKQYLAQKLAVSQGNIAVTARSCGIGIRTLSRKMREYGLDKKSFKHKEPVAETAPKRQNLISTPLRQLRDA